VYTIFASTTFARENFEKICFREKKEKILITKKPTCLLLKLGGLLESCHGRGQMFLVGGILESLHQQLSLQKASCCLQQ
jgi:hypothetical protein